MNEKQSAASSESYDDLKHRSVEALKIKLQAHRWWLEDYDEWSLMQDEGVLVIQSSARGQKVEARAPAQIIGTLNRNDGTWLWAWANKSIATSDWWSR